MYQKKGSRESLLAEDPNSRETTIRIQPLDSQAFSMNSGTLEDSKGMMKGEGSRKEELES